MNNPSSRYSDENKQSNKSFSPVSFGYEGRDNSSMQQNIIPSDMNSEDFNKTFFELNMILNNNNEHEYVPIDVISNNNNNSGKGRELSDIFEKKTPSNIIKEPEPMPQQNGGRKKIITTSNSDRPMDSNYNDPLTPYNSALFKEYGLSNHSISDTSVLEDFNDHETTSEFKHSISDREKYHSRNRNSNEYSETSEYYSEKDRYKNRGYEEDDSSITNSSSDSSPFMAKIIDDPNEIKLSTNKRSI